MSAGVREGLRQRLAAGPGRIARAARAAVRAEASNRVPGGEWSAREVVGHLVATERDVFQARLDQLEMGGTPHWDWVEPGVPEGPEVATLDVALTTFVDLRRETLRRVAGVDEHGWARSGVHATLGVLDVAGLLEIAADHDEDHRRGLLARARSS